VDLAILLGSQISANMDKNQFLYENGKVYKETGKFINVNLVFIIVRIIQKETLKWWLSEVLVIPIVCSFPIKPLLFRKKIFLI
jgi:hypothetical protein